MDFTIFDTTCKVMNRKCDFDWACDEKIYGPNKYHSYETLNCTRDDGTKFTSDRTACGC